MLAQFTSWLRQPFETNMSAVRWFAWIGLIIACLMIWGMILRLLEENT